jgi:exopolysaccharide biosynthesis protein
MQNIILKRFLKVAVFLISLVTALLFVFYGPFEFVRETWVTSAMTTMSHQWMATALYDKNTIDEILQKNKMVPSTEHTDPSLIEERHISSDRIDQLDVSTNNFRAFLLKVYDPRRINLVPCEDLGNKGQRLFEIIKQYNAIGGINASGFLDSSGHTKGGIPNGLIMKNKKILFCNSAGSLAIVGFDKDKKLILGNYTQEELLKSNIEDAVAFSPLLIVNSKPTEIKGNGGWGIAPRTAIGQTKDGIVLLLVIDGRQLSSFGATIKDIQDIMIKYGAVNAANLDGGSSSIMMYKDKNVNYPCTSKTGRYLPSAILISK